MLKHGYKSLAGIYDLVNHSKDYAGETFFLKGLFEKYGVKTVLDAGCGTGTHMGLLEQYGFQCDGIDLNQEMLDIARGKVKGKLIRANMAEFDLAKRYDAVISMFASFNHLIKPEDARKAIRCFRQHLNDSGIILIDLHNPQCSGRKSDKTDGIQRTMEWTYDPETRVETTSVVFDVEGNKIEDRHTMRIYSIDEMLEMVAEEGFSEPSAFEGYGFRPAKSTSKNIEIFAKK